MHNSVYKLIKMLKLLVIIKLNWYTTKLYLCVSNGLPQITVQKKHKQLAQNKYTEKT